MASKYLAVKNPQKLKAVADHWNGLSRRVSKSILDQAEIVAQELVNELKDRIDRGHLPGPAEVGGGHWEETGFLRDHIQVIRTENNVYVGIPPGIEEAPSGRRKSRGTVDITKIAFELEIGAVVGNVHYPPRPLLRTTVNELRAKLSQELDAMVKQSLGQR